MRESPGASTAGPNLEGLFEGPGEMRALMRATDWSCTPLGPVAGWPQSLRTVLSICIASRFPIFIWWGPELVMLYNDAYRPMLGATKHPRALGAPGRDIWPEIWHIIGPMLRRVREAGEATWSADQLLLLDRNGYVEETYFTFSYSPIEDESGGVGGVFCAVTETTERVIGERRLRLLRELGTQVDPAATEAESVQRSVEILRGEGEDVPFAVFYTLADDQPTLRRAGLAGLVPDAAPEQLPAEGWPFAGLVAQVSRSGQVVRVLDLPERVARYPGGGWGERAQEAIVLPVRGGAGDQVVGVLLAGVSPRRRLDDAYVAFFELAAGHLGSRLAAARAYDAERRRAESLAELDRAKTAFFSNVSHEFRTPLTLLLAPLEEAIARGDESLAVAHRNALRLLKLVNTLLEFSRIEAGRVAAAYEPVDLASLTTELAATFRSAIERAGLALRVDAAPLAEPVYVDRDMWEKIVLNLLSNAFKHTFEGEIAVVLHQAGGTCTLEVRDTGVGIPAAQLPHLFERFHRVPNARSRTYEGTGIGLALVQELVGLHGGEVTVASEEGVGSTFTVRIPCGTSHLPAEHVAGASDRPVPTAAAAAVPFVAEALRWLPDHPQLADTVEMPVPVGGRAGRSPVQEPRARVLVADDNADMRAYAGRLLGSRWEVELAPDGVVALERVRLAHPDLVLADVMMPGLDGFALLRELRADPATREIPVILLSARAGEESRVEGLDAGADDYMVKPFSARELLAKVGATLELARVRREAAAALERRTAEFETLLAAAPIGVFLVDDELRIREVNPTAAAAFGDIPDLIGRDYGEVVRVLWPADAAAELVRIFRHTLVTGEPYAGTEFTHQRLDRSRTEHYEWQVNRIPLPDGRNGVVCYFRDISAQVRASVAVAESQERLRQSAKMEAVGRLAGGLAHDFNNQLQALRGFAAYAAQEPNLGPQAREDLREVLKAADRMADLTRQLLAFSRQQVLRPELLDLDQTVTDNIDLVRRLVGSHIEFRVEHGPGVKPVYADRTQLLQVLMNLCINARDAMPDGGRLEVRTALLRVDSPESAPSGGADIALGAYAQLTVTDTGSGIAAEHLPHIFEPFFTTKEVGQGTGLGLATVHGIVAQSRGHVSVESAAGWGTRFTVLLPIAGTPAASPEPPAQQRDRAPRSTVLVVEDEPAVRHLLVRMIGDAGYEALEAGDGSEALELLRAKGDTVALVLSDVVMPVMGGTQLAARLRELRPSLPLIWMSGYPRDIAFAEGEDTAGRPFLQKPVSAEALAQAIGHALRAPSD